MELWNPIYFLTWSIKRMVKVRKDLKKKKVYIQLFLPEVSNLQGLRYISIDQSIFYKYFHGIKYQKLSKKKKKKTFFNPWTNPSLLGEDELYKDFLKRSLEVFWLSFLQKISLFLHILMLNIWGLKMTFFLVNATFLFYEVWMQTDLQVNLFSFLTSSLCLKRISIFLEIFFRG